MKKIIRVTYFIFNQAENWMQAHVIDETGATSVKNIIPSALSAYLQTEGTGHGQKYGHNLSEYVFHAPTRAYVNQVIANYLNAAAAAQISKGSAKDQFMEIREWESTHRLNNAYRFLKSA